jgi:hypothetical protein
MLFFIAYGAWVALAYPYHLYFKEQLTLFTGYRLPYLQKPAFLGEWLGDYLTQFFLLTGAGPAILTAVLALLWFGLRLAFQRTGIKQNAGLLALLPIAIEAVLSCHLEYPLSMVIGATIAVWVFVALTYLKNKTVFFLTACVLTVSLYLLAGAHFLLFALLVLSEEIRSKNWIFSATISIIAIATPLTAGYFYYLTYSQSYFYPIIERYLLKQPYLFLLTETTLLSAFVLDHYKIKKVFSYGIALIVIVGGMYEISDFKEEYNLGLSSEAYFGHWNKVKALSQNKKYNTYFSAYYGNLANAREGKLADELLKQYQPADLGLFFEIRENASYINLMVSPDVLMECGDMAQAQHSAMLAMLFTPHQRSSRMIRKLATIAITNGEYPTAKKYLTLLSKTTLHRRWANENLQFIVNNTNFDFSGKRVFLSQHDTLFSSNDWRTPLVNLLESNPQNKTAADYLLCHHLLRKDLELFKADYDAYFYPTFGYSPAKLYQEALLICIDGNDEQQYDAEVRKYCIDAEVWSKSHEFLSLVENARHNERKISSTFAATYWFYYLYAQLK